jgi:predicted nucleic acid-binding protein
VRVILDTNVVLSALVRRNSAPGQILEAWPEDRFVLLIHPWSDADAAVIHQSYTRRVERPLRSEHSRRTKDARGASNG